jgi:peptidyl-prolyl cis-trans isomerase C
MRVTGGNISLATALLVTVAVLQGCTKKVGGQVVAVVNGEEITQQELRAEAEAAQIPASQDFDSVAPSLLQRVVERNLLVGYAREQGLDRGPEYVARRRQLEQTLLATLALRKLTGGGTAPRVTPDEVQKYIADHPTAFAARERLSLDQLQFPAPRDRSMIQTLTKLENMDAIEAKLKADGLRVTRGKPVLDTAMIDPAVAKQIVALPPGQLFDLTAGPTTFISVVTARAPAATPPQTWTAIATEAAKRDKATKGVRDTLEQLRRKAKIEYDPALKPPPQKPAA